MSDVNVSEIREEVEYLTTEVEEFINNSTNKTLKTIPKKDTADTQGIPITDYIENYAILLFAEESKQKQVYTDFIKDTNEKLEALWEVPTGNTKSTAALNLVEKIEEHRIAIHELVKANQDKLQKRYKELDDLARAENSQPLADHIFEIIPPRKQNTTRKTIPATALTVNETQEPDINPNHMEIPIFYGDITEWKAFYLCFKPLVIDNKKLPNVQKHLILKKYLRGKPLELVKPYSTDGTDFDVAVKRLVKFYDSDDSQFEHLWRRLDKMEISAATPEALRSTHNELFAIFNGLKSHVDIENSMFESMIRTKLPARILNDCLKYEPENTSKFLDTLDEVITREEKVQRAQKFYQKQDNVVLAVKNTVTNSANKSIQKNCAFCGRNNHSTRECKQVSTIQKRKEFIKTKKLCFNCLKPGHNVKECKSKNCFYCSKKHHSSICPTYIQQSNGQGPQNKNQNQFTNQFQNQNQFTNQFQNQNQFTNQFQNQNHFTNQYQKQPQNQFTNQYQNQQYQNRQQNNLYQNTNYQNQNSNYQKPQFQSQNRNQLKNNAQQNNQKKPYYQNYQAHPVFENQQSELQMTWQNFEIPQQMSTQNAIQNLQSMYPNMNHQKPKTIQEQIDPVRNLSVVTSHTSLMILKAPIVHNHNIERIPVLLDTGADQSFILSEYARKHNLEVVEKNVKIDLTVFGRDSCIFTTDKVQFEILTNKGTVKVVAVTVPEITSMIQPVQFSEEDSAFLQQQNYYVVNTTEPETPIALLGCDVFWKLISNDEKIQLPSGKFVIPTYMGPLVCGKQEYGNTEPTHNHALIARIREHVDEKYSEVQMEEFFEVENIGIKPDQEEQTNQELIENFYKTVTIDPENHRVVVSLPWKPGQREKLANNKQISYCRLKQQYEQLKGTEQWNELAESFAKMENNDVIEEVLIELESGFFIPFQIVFNMSSNTTKARTVFDASSKKKGEISLNNALYQGPSLLPELQGMLMRTRRGKYICIGDIEKAFHTVQMKEEDRDALRFLWLKDPALPPTSDNLKVMRFKRLPFGVNCSPFLLTMAIKYGILRSDAPQIVKDAVNNMCYVDNIFFTSDSKEEVKNFYLWVKKYFKDIGMNVREFAVNFEEDFIKDEDRAKNLDNIKTLGYLFDIYKDTLSVKKPILNIDENNLPKMTKRTAVSEVATIFDPLQYHSPLYLEGKNIIREISDHQIKWNDLVPQKIVERVVKYRKKLERTDLSFKRNIDPQGPLKICVFSDASEDAYGSAAYLISEKDGKSYSELLTAKQRISPKKVKMTIPKLELLGVLIGVRLLNYVIKELHLNIKNIEFYTDSTIVLSQIKNKDKYDSLPIFVRRRCEEIWQTLQKIKETQKDIEINIYHVPTGDNPADLITRGSNSAESLKETNWYKGPDWLVDINHVNHPRNNTEFKIKIDLDDEPEIETISLSIVTTSKPAKAKEIELLNMSVINNIDKIERLTAYMLRFIKHRVFDKISEKSKAKLRKHIPELIEYENRIDTKGMIRLHELRISRKCLVRRNQEIFHISDNKNNQSLNRYHHEHDGLIYQHFRVTNMKEKPVMETNSELARLIVEKMHRENFHAGPATTLGLILDQYSGKWKRKVKKTVKSCSVCKMKNSHPYPKAPPGILPPRRTVESRPFQHVGVDFMGPIKIRTTNSTDMNGYVALFTCTATRLVHLEVVRDLSTNRFLLALSRFISRRGCPDTITSDNGATFVLTSKIMARCSHQKLHPLEEIETKKFSSEKEKFEFIMTTAVEREMARRNIIWYFNTALSPWQGGFFERLVGLVKKALKHALGDDPIESDELDTIIAECEAIVNRRPLTYVDEDNEDLMLIRPIDIITPNFTTAEMDENIMENDYRTYTDKFRQTRQHVRRFWTVFQRDYIKQNKNFQTIAQESRAYSQQNIPILGEVVLMVDEKEKRENWNLGIIHELIKGRDGFIRSAIVKTTQKTKKKDGTLPYVPTKKILVTRPLKLLIPLELRPQKPKNTVVNSTSANLIITKPSITQKTRVTSSKSFKSLMFMFLLMLFSLNIQSVFAAKPADFSALLKTGISRNLTNSVISDTTTTSTTTTTEAMTTMRVTGTKPTTEKEFKATSTSATSRTNPSTTTTTTPVPTTTKVRTTTTTERATVSISFKPESTSQKTESPIQTTTQIPTTVKVITTTETTIPTSTESLKTTSEIHTNTVPEELYNNVNPLIRNAIKHHAELPNPQKREMVYYTKPSKNTKVETVTTPMTTPTTQTPETTPPVITTTTDEDHHEKFQIVETKSKIECVLRGVNLIDEDDTRNASNTVCTHDWCNHEIVTYSRITLVDIPPEYTTHKHKVSWKKPVGNKYTIIEEKCPPVDFCTKARLEITENSCIFCKRFLFNSQCHPKVTIGLFIMIAIIPLKLCITIHQRKKWINLVKSCICCKKQKSKQNDEEIEMNEITVETSPESERKDRTFIRKITQRMNKNRKPVVKSRQSKYKMKTPGKTTRKRTFEITTIMEDGEERMKINKTSSRSPSPTTSLMLTISIILTIVTITQADVCDKTIPISHEEISCDNRNSCHIERTEDLFYTPQTKSACIQLVAKNQVLAKIKLMIDHNFRRCEKGPIMYTKNVTVQSASSKRCHGMGECVDRKCLDIGPKSKLVEFPEENKFPGTTYCTTSCGGMWCKCLLPTPGCLFYRTYAVPTSDDKFQIYDCESWSNKIVFESTTTVNNSVNIESFILRQGDEKQFSYNQDQLKMTIRLIDISEESGLGVLGKKFIQKDEKIALASITNEIFPLECNEIGKCEYKETCMCQPSEEAVNCECKVPDLHKILEDKEHNLPIITERYHLGISNDNVPSIKMRHNKLHIQVTIDKQYEVTSIESDIDCSITEQTKYTGCYNCLKGANQNVTCRSREPTHAKLSCDNDEFIEMLTCDRQGVVNEVHRKFNSSRPTGVCTVTCGSKRNSFKIEGELIFVAHDSLAEYFSQVLNSEKGITDIHPRILPDFSSWLDTLSKEIEMSNEHQNKKRKLEEEEKKESEKQQAVKQLATMMQASHQVFEEKKNAEELERKRRDLEEKEKKRLVSRCRLCRKKGHFAFECPENSSNDKFQDAVTKKLCIICLGSDKSHSLHECYGLRRSSSLCNKSFCLKRHRLHHASICNADILKKEEEEDLLKSSPQQQQQQM